jgi:hypothetical protein
VTTNTVRERTENVEAFWRVARRKHAAKIDI